MELKRVVLVLADISGYTRFMKIHTMSLLHAETIITELLEAVLDHAEFPLTLSKLEGDAAFMYATPLPPRPAPAPPSRDNPELMALLNRMNDYAVKRALGRVEQPRFSHLPNEKLSPLSLLSYFVGGTGANILAVLQHQRSQKQAKG